MVTRAIAIPSFAGPQRKGRTDSPGTARPRTPGAWTDCRASRPRRQRASMASEDLAISPTVDRSPDSTGKPLSARTHPALPRQHDSQQPQERDDVGFILWREGDAREQLEHERV